MGLDSRLTEAGNPATADIDRACTAEIVELINAEDRRVAPAVAAEAVRISRLIDAVARRIGLGGRLVYVGAGTSGRLGVLDAAECPPTFGSDPALVRGVMAGGVAALRESQEGVEDDEEAGRAAIEELDIGTADFVLGIAASGTTPFVRAAIEEAKRRGAGIGVLSCTPAPRTLIEMADLSIAVIVGPEVIAGSTRMKAGTATKLVLNTLTTGVMIRAGKVYRNLMVDLQAKSRKLADRSIRIVGEVCGLDYDAARKVLLAAGGSSKTAIAMHRLRTSRAVAERALDECDGFLGDALDRFAGTVPPYYSGYPRDFDTADATHLIERLGRAPERLRNAVEEETPAERRRSLWGAAEHLAHLLECETVAFRPRIERMLAADAPHFEDWTPSAQPVVDGDVETLLSRFAAQRRQTVDLIEPLEDAAWSRRATIGDEEVILYQLLRGVAQHDEAHALRIRERIHPALAKPTEGDSRSGVAAS